MFPRYCDLESGIDDTIGLHSGNGDIEAPEEDKDARGDGLEGFGTAKLSTHRGVPSGHEDEDGKASLDAEHGHGEAQAGNGRILSETYIAQSADHHTFRRGHRMWRPGTPSR